MQLYGGHKNIIFDFGNVLFDLDLSATRRKMKSLLGDKFDAVYDKIRQYKLFELYETGGISTEEFLETIKTASNNQVSESELRDAWNSILSIPYTDWRCCRDCVRNTMYFC